MNMRMRGHWIANHQVDANKLYAVLCCIAYWLDAMKYGDDFKFCIFQLLHAYPSVDTAAMGFPKGWEKEQLWESIKSTIIF